MRRPLRTRVWFWKPEWHWFGWKTLLPIHTGCDEHTWHTVVLGWTITGRLLIATRQCRKPEHCWPLPDWMEELQ